MNHRGLISLLIISMWLLLLVFGFIIINSGNFVTMAQTSYTSEQPQSSKARGESRVWGLDQRMGGIDSADLEFDQINPAVVSDNDNYIYCAWQDNRNDDWNIYFSKSGDKGENWATNLRISNTTLSLGNQRQVSIAINPNYETNLFVVWQDERNDSGDIYYSYSEDRGDTWSTEILVNTDTPKDTEQSSPAIACDGTGDLFIVWADNYKNKTGEPVGDWDIKLSTSKDNGKTWSKPVLVNDQPLYGKDQSQPVLAVDANGIIQIAWVDDRNDEKQIFMSRSTDHGLTFSEDLQISSLKQATTVNGPEIAVDANNNVIITWLEDYNSNYNVYFTKSLDYGASFYAPVRVNAQEDVCHAEATPAVLVGENANIYATWSDIRAKNHIYVGHSKNSGKSFTDIKRVDGAGNTSATGLSQTTQEELYRGQAVPVRLKDDLFIFWTDYRNNPDPDNDKYVNGDIYFSWDAVYYSNYIPEKTVFDKDETTSGWWYINLSWEVSRDLDFAQYIIHKSIKKDFNYDDTTKNDTISNRELNYLNITGFAVSTTYYFRLVVMDRLGLTQVSDQFAFSTKSNIPPFIELIQPNGSLNDIGDSSYEIYWHDADLDDNAMIRLFYDKDLNLDNKQAIVTVPYGEDSYNDSYTWDTREVPNGSYYIIAIISDPVNGEQYPVISPGKVKIYHGNQDPWLTILPLPPKNISNFKVIDTIEVRFNKIIDLNTVHLDSFNIKDSNDTKIIGEFEFNSSTNKLIFEPNTPWKYSEKYFVNLTTSIKDKSGLFELDHDYSWWFETEEAPILDGRIDGIVVDEYYNDTIEGALVTLIDIDNRSNAWQEITDMYGEFSFYVPYGAYELNISAASFQNLPVIQIDLNQPIVELHRLELFQPLIIDFNIKNKITVDEKLKASASATHPKNTDLTYIWDFGDGTEMVGQKAAHKYKKPGNYEVTLMVKDDNNGTASITESVIVEEAKDDYFTIFVISAIIILVVGLIIIFFALHIARKHQTEQLDKLGGRIVPGKAEEMEKRKKIEKGKRRAKKREKGKKGEKKEKFEKKRKGRAAPAKPGKARAEGKTKTRPSSREKQKDKGRTTKLGKVKEKASKKKK